MPKLRVNILPSLTNHKWVVIIGLASAMSMALLVRLPQPISHPNIGEIDVYYWALRTQELELHGLNQVGTPFWGLPLVMAGIHKIVPVSLYDLFLWTGSILSAIFPTIGLYLLTREISSSRGFGLAGAVVYALSPMVLYRSVFTVSETLAYCLIPWILYLTVRLVKRGEYLTLAGLSVSLWLALQTHDSAKLLVLPTVIAMSFFFFRFRKKRYIWYVLSGLLLLLVTFIFRNQGLIAEVRFFLWPPDNGNSAFGQFDPLQLNEYVQNFPWLVSSFTFIGLLLASWMAKKQRLGLILVISFVLPILYYQQIQPRIAESTIVPFRLTPFLTFAAIPLFIVAAQVWLQARQRNLRFVYITISIGLALILSRTAVANFPLDYITSLDEQTSLRQLPIRTDDYLVVQTGMIGMTALATKTNESNYYGDISSQIFSASSTKDLDQRLDTFNHQAARPLTGVLISKWKLSHRDLNYGWWDSLLNPEIKLNVFQQAGFKIRYQDDNLVLFDLPITN